MAGEEFRNIDERIGRRMQCGAEESAVGVSNKSGWWIRRDVEDEVRSIDSVSVDTLTLKAPIMLIMSPGGDILYEA